MNAGAIAAVAAKVARERGRTDPAPLPATLALLLLAMWGGAALLFTSVVAPAAFAVLPQRALAGAVVGRVLPVLFLSGMAVAGVSGLLRLRSGQARSWAWRAGLVVLFGGCAVAQFVIGPRIERLRAELPASIESVPTSDPRRRAFGQLHGVSVAFMGLGMVGAVVALAAGAWPTRNREEA